MSVYKRSEFEIIYENLKFVLQTRRHVMSGFGRGGRGQALLKALSQPVRRPGQSPEEQQPTSPEVILSC